MTRYAELHCKTNYSFLEGGSHADELVATAKAQGYAALAVTDRNSLAGVVRAHVEAKEQGLKLIIGAEIHPLDAPPVVLWVTDRQSYGRLCRLITVGRRRAPKGSCELYFADIAEHAAGLIAGVVPQTNHAGFRPNGAEDNSPGREPWVALDVDEDGVYGRGLISEVVPRAIPPLTPPRERGGSSRFPSLEGGGQGRDLETAQTRTPNSHHWWINDLDKVHRYRDVFSNRLYLLAELFRGPDDVRRLQELQAISKAAGIPLVAANDVHYHSPNRLPLHDVLTAIRLGTTVDAVGANRFPNAERHLRSIEEITMAFADARDAVQRTIEIAERCTFNLDELRYEYPEELVPAGRTPSEYLAELTWAGAHKQYPGGVPDKVRRIVEHELQLIEELRYEAYFLTVFDLVRFARERAILCQGRGSAANSAVCFCLGVTSVDPDRIEVLFERFISKERNEAPDIDVDFEHERREEVLQYLYDKYGRERAGLAATVITYCARSAVRDVGKALGLSLDSVDALAKQIDGHHHGAVDAARCELVGIDPQSSLGRRLVFLVNEILGFPRHLSQHVGGMVMTQGPLCELVPIENAAMENRSVVQWDKDDLDALGILKVDVLALGMLSAIRKCFAMVKQHYGRELTLANVPAEDPLVYDMICEADTVGVFQIESRGQMSMLPRLRPRCYYDLVIEVAIVRPGPIQGQMVHPYLRRRHGEEVPSYPNDEIKAVLHRTLGVPLFQEQAMKLAVVAAGFTPGEADQLRRAMGAWRKTGVMEKFRIKLIEGMRANGLSDQFAEQVFTQIRGFGEYGFPESHAASFALLVYVSAWLKCYYPAAFTASLLNSLPMGFYAPAQLVSDARRHGVPILPVDVNYSDGDCTLEVTPSPQPSPAGGEGVKPEPPILAPSGLTNSVLAPTGQRIIAQGVSPGSWSVPPPSPEPQRGDTEGVTPSGLAVAEVSTQGLRPRLLSATPSGLNNHESSWNGGESHSIALRLGYRLVAGLKATTSETIVAARREGPFGSMQDLIRRTQLSRPELEILADADAFGSLTMHRRQALWQAMAQSRTPKAASLFNGVEVEEANELLPVMAPFEQVITDYRTTGLSLKGHPLEFFRAELQPLRVAVAESLITIPHGRRITVAGMVILRQRPATAKGITFCTLEDETGTFNLVVKQHIWERFGPIVRGSQAWIAHGVLERKGSVIHVVVDRIEDMSQRLGQIRMTSRHFR